MLIPSAIAVSGRGDPLVRRQGPRDPVGQSPDIRDVTTVIRELSGTQVFPRTCGTATENAVGTTYVLAGLHHFLLLLLRQTLVTLAG